jgi:hypothetical protein
VTDYLSGLALKHWCMLYSREDWDRLAQVLCNFCLLLWLHYCYDSKEQYHPTSERWPTPTRAWPTNCWPLKSSANLWWCYDAIAPRRLLKTVQHAAWSFQVIGHATLSSSLCCVDVRHPCTYVPGVSTYVSGLTVGLPDTRVLFIELISYYLTALKGNCGAAAGMWHSLN